MAKTVVSFHDALEVIKKNMVKDKHYKYGDLSDVLKVNFDGINNNQISGLINKLSDKGFFEKEKIVGSRMDYVYTDKSLNNSNDLKERVNEFYTDFLINLNNMKKDIDKADDFNWVQKKIDGLKDLFKD